MRLTKREFLQTAAAGAVSLLPMMTVCGSDNAQEPIKAFCIDFNWLRNPSRFPSPGHWADADPKEHVKWYKDLGCNTIQTFCVSCNGYAWYRGNAVPEQTGLKFDFLPEMVELGHKEKMKVFGYYCAGANRYWKEKYPDENHDTPTWYHIPFTNRYLDYLSVSIEDALKKTGIDGFMVDWLWNPEKDLWLKCEQEMYAELMSESFPGADKVSKEQTAAYRKKALNRCWKRIYETAKSVSPKCLIWLSCDKPDHLELDGSPLWQQVDWFQNEAGDIERLKKIAAKVGKQTRLLTTLAWWNKQDPVKLVKAASEAGIDIGMYSYAMPTQGSLLPPVSSFLAKPINDFDTPNDRNIATLARVYNGLALDYVST